ncbi:hypothetical protein FBUS_05351 [Fasciolopsis buskii]|uniref:EGF-like domain-containing protein n=1 Tax=Fasciolopsis buskii TaxID=27845 RepID=A0A8E0S0A9_9TREM|nr:hypothetical protein FBUS_05351 [Fasciolopsis buski]
MNGSNPMCNCTRGHTVWLFLISCSVSDQNYSCVDHSPPNLYVQSCRRTGRRCEHRDPCVTNPCHSHGRCVSNNLGHFLCDCNPGWMGADCSKDMDECHMDEISPCAHGGICINTVSDNGCFLRLRAVTFILVSSRTSPKDNTIPTQFHLSVFSICVCSDQDEDDFIVVIVIVVLSQPGSFFCQCPGGFAGPRCEEVVLHCLSRPCRYGGRCIEGPGTYRCECTPASSGNAGAAAVLVTAVTAGDDEDDDAGYTGHDCETEINECADSPCEPNGQCEDLVGAYQCHCFPGWTGRHCEIRRLTCADWPCQNDATCEDILLPLAVNRTHAFRCHCSEGEQSQRVLRVCMRTYKTIRLNIESESIACFLRIATVIMESPKFND